MFCVAAAATPAGTGVKLFVVFAYRCPFPLLSTPLGRGSFVCSSPPPLLSAAHARYLFSAPPPRLPPEPVSRLRSVPPPRLPTGPDEIVAALERLGVGDFSNDERIIHSCKAHGIFPGEVLVLVAQLVLTKPCIPQYFERHHLLICKQ